MSSMQPMETAETIIRTRGLTKSIEETTLLNNINLDIRSGEFYGLLGPLGSGSSTLVKILATILPASGGAGEICKLDISTQAHEIRRKIGYLPEIFGAYEDMRIREYMSFFGMS